MIKPLMECCGAYSADAGCCPFPKKETNEKVSSNARGKSDEGGRPVRRDASNRTNANR